MIVLIYFAPKHNSYSVRLVINYSKEYVFVKVKINFTKKINKVRMTCNIKQTVALVGMMGSGKTVIGRGLARKLNASFIDLDQEIIKSANLEIEEIFNTFGEGFFRDKEEKVLERLIYGAPVVLATGGGTLISKTNLSLILNKTFSIWLKSNPKIIWNRIKNKKNRPLVNNCKDFSDFNEIYKSREKLYKNANICVSNNYNYSVEKMIEKTFEGFNSYNQISYHRKDKNA